MTPTAQRAPSETVASRQDAQPSAPWTHPFLRWAGSKRKLLPYLSAAAPRDFLRYVEPFAGSACLFFALRPAQAILGDLNANLISTYETLRSHPRRVAAAVSKLVEQDDYYACRALDPESLDDIPKAARFIYLNRHCFNGVYRTNRRGQFNVPRGRNTGAVPTAAHLYRCSYALRRTRLVHGDFQRTLDLVSRDDFVYLDPPYATSSRPTFGEYGYGSFSDTDLSRLLDGLDAIDRRGGRFLLSYANSPELLGNVRASWSVNHLRVQRHVSGFARHRHMVREILVSNYA